MTHEIPQSHAVQQATFERRMPASFKLAQRLRDLAAVTGPIAAQKCIDLGQEGVGDGFTSFDDKTTPKWTNVSIGPIDAVQMESLLVEEKGLAFIDLTFKTFSDGSPFIFDNDLFKSHPINSYDLAIFPEHPPFLILAEELCHKEREVSLEGNGGFGNSARRVLEALRESVYVLTEADCQSLLDAVQINGSGLVEHIETA